MSRETRSPPGRHCPSAVLGAIPIPWSRCLLPAAESPLFWVKWSWFTCRALTRAGSRCCAFWRSPRISPAFPYGSSRRRCFSARCILLWLVLPLSPPVARRLVGPLSQLPLLGRFLDLGTAHLSYVDLCPPQFFLRTSVSYILAPLLPPRFHTRLTTSKLKPLYPITSFG